MHYMGMMSQTGFFKVDYNLAIVGVRCVDGGGREAERCSESGDGDAQYSGCMHLEGCHGCAVGLLPSPSLVLV